MEDALSPPPTRPKGPLRATTASVALGPTIWLSSFCAGFATEPSALLGGMFIATTIGYAIGFGLAVWGLLGIPRAGTGGVLGLGLLGGVMNGFFLTASGAAYLIYFQTYG